jgi:eukaryotic-like serine/threonine-protein kinase
VLDAQTGKVKWQEWLGDPLMSQPAISKGKLYIAYPGGQRGKGKSGHRLLCANLQTGKHIWDQPITADVISAPIIEGDKVFVTCMDGTSFSMEADSGKMIWKKANSGTSAPVVAKGQFVVAKRAGAAGKAIEGIQIMDARVGEEQKDRYLAASPAPYLQGATNGTIGPQKGNSAGWFGSLDSSVGFGGGAPADAQMHKAASNLNIKSVAGAWGYQGAKSSYKHGSLYNSQRTMINSVNPASGKVNWQAEARGKVVTGETQVFSPPSLGKSKMYLCSGDGHLVTMNQSDGKVADMFATNHPISFQPALAEGNVYIGTANGMLVCLKTGDQDAVDWTAWAGNSAHNKQD